MVFNGFQRVSPDVLLCLSKVFWNHFKVELSLQNLLNGDVVTVNRWIDQTRFRLFSACYGHTRWLFQVQTLVLNCLNMCKEFLSTVTHYWKPFMRFIWNYGVGSSLHLTYLDQIRTRFWFDSVEINMFVFHLVCLALLPTHSHHFLFLVIDSFGIMGFVLPLVYLIEIIPFILHLVCLD